MTGLKAAVRGAGLMLLAALATPAAAQDFDLTMAVLPAPNTAYLGLTATVPDRIAEATGGRVKVVLNDSLVGGPQIAAAVRDGRVPMSAAVHTYLAAEDPRMGLFNLPGLIDDMADYAFICEAFWCGDLEKLWLERWNAVVLAEGAWCTTQLFSKEPIHTLEDFKNKRLRVHNPQTATLMDALGAKPTPLPLSEVMPALERGVIDGLFTSACYGNGQEYWRLAKNVQDWGIGPVTGWAVIVNADSWAEIPEDLQAAIRMAMQGLQHDALYGYYEFVGEAMANMKAEGVEVWAAPDSEKARIFAPEYTQQVFDSWYDRAESVGFDGRAYVARARAVLGKDLEQ
ncbi:MAG: C4-dicarboxylate ABC transporter substrate-binding protein [Rhodospirillaceae bacterium]|nr:C4-dicarboxylate ABC transporter substrate-binding protein [Rhodospirillaceae bacterium]